MGFPNDSPSRRSPRAASPDQTGGSADLEAVRLSEASLTAWGELIGRSATVPLVIALRGDLGAGKTTLARAIARGAGVPGRIPSPTYNLVLRHRSEGGVEVAHLDLYRLESEDEVWELGWSELPAENELVLIEWPERAEGLLPTPRWEVRLEEDDDPSRRRVEVHRVGEPPPIRMPEEVVP